MEERSQNGVSLEGWVGVGGSRKVQEEGDICIPIHVDVCQKST